MFMTIFFPALLLGGIGMFFGYILAFAAKVFYIETDHKIDEILAILPNVNCGACGFPGCSGYAEAIVEKGADVSMCPPGGIEVSKKIAEIMGKTASEKEKTMAVIHCNSGGYSNTSIKYKYHGIQSCRAAILLSGGPNLCNFGCVFQNDCISACQFGAMYLDENGMRTIDHNKCRSCEACAKACPRGLVELVPISKTLQINCSSKDKGIITKKICGSKKHCIGCGICAKNCPFKAIVFENNLAKIDYQKCQNCGLCAVKCPTKVIIDTQKRGKAHIDPHTCIGCTICAKKCVVNCISGELKRMHTVDREKCIGCEICVEKCPKKAIVIEY